MKKIFNLVIGIAVVYNGQAQNVGIGTNTPGAKLHVIGNGVGSSTSTLILRNAGLDTLLRVIDNGNTTIGYTGAVSSTLSLGGNGMKFYTPNNGPYQGGVYPSFSGNSLVVSGANHLLLQAEGGSVAIGTSSPSSSAALDVTSTNRGILFPRVADTSSIASPVKGLVIFSNANNKLWYYDGGQWRSAGGGAGGDNLWYLAQDSITHSSSSFVGINTDIDILPPQASLQVSGSLLIQGELKHTNAAPTAGQVYIMNNTSVATQITGDSVFRIYDPGGTGNYLNNTQGNVSCSTYLSQHVGFKVSSVAADFGLGTGDTLWVSRTTFPSCRTDYIYRFTNTIVNPADFVINGIFYLLFRSNGDGNNNKGFNFLLTRLYHQEDNKKILTAGPALYFNGGNGSFAAGSSAEAGSSSIAIGNSAKAPGYLSVAIGTYANAGDQTATALGPGAFATGFGATAVGAYNTASGIFSTAIGYDNQATAENAFAMGTSTQATGMNSISSGYGSEATGRSSYAAGYYTIGRGYGGTVVGMFNNPVLGSPQTTASSTTPLFIVGNGDDNNDRSNALIVLKNGNVGIGVSGNPGDRLDIDGGNMTLNNTSGTTIQLQAGGVQKGFVQLSGDNIRVGTYSSNSTGNFIVRTNGADQLTVFPSGNATLAGTLTQSSDARFKQDIMPVEDALSKVMRLNGYQYHWKTELKKDKGLQIGLIAQNVESVLPELVITADDGMKSVAYQNMVPVLIEAMKEQQQMIKDQQRQINELKKLVKP